MKITYQLPAIAAGQAKQVITAALDVGLAAHRSRFLPIHFTATAISRYPSEYATACPKTQQTKAKAAAAQAQIKAMLDGMTPTARQDWHRHRKDKAAARKALDAAQPLRSLDPQNLIPLVDTGRLRASVLSGAVQLQGRPELREMKFNPPFYTFIKTKPKKTQGDWFDKKAALEAITPDEETAFAATLDRELQQALNA
jgi:hypothetical protein